MLPTAARIYNSGTMTLSNSTLEGNAVDVSSGSNYGGGIYNTGTMTVTNSTVASSTPLLQPAAAPYAGGIYTTGTLNLLNTIVAGNSATTADPDVDGTVTGSALQRRQS